VTQITFPANQIQLERINSPANQLANKPTRQLPLTTRKAKWTQGFDKQREADRNHGV